jgi:ComF family protein
MSARPFPRLSLPPRRWPRLLLDALLPSVCALCGAGCDGVVCAGCQRAYVLARRRCARCANPLPHLDAHERPSSLRRQGPNLAPLAAHATLDPRLRRDDGERLRRDDGERLRGNDGERLRRDDAVCGACLSHPPAFDATVAAADYAAPIDQLVLQLKFGARLALAPWFARMLRDAVLAHPGLALPDLLCPVPLGAGRLAGRGFNQALEIARPLAGALGVALHPRLAARMLETVAQSGVAPAQRGRNVRGAFAVTDPDLVAGRHVGLVDDVMTSGHTLAELAATFKRFGAARVTNLVFARTPPNK